MLFAFYARVSSRLHETSIEMKIDLPLIALALLVAVPVVACGPSSSVGTKTQEVPATAEESGKAAEAEAATVDRPAYAFVFPWKETTLKLFLVGAFDGGIKLTLLDPASEATCPAETSNQSETLDSSDAPITELEGECLANAEFGLAALDTKVDDFAPVPLQAVEEAKVQSVDETVRGSGVLAALLAKAQDSSAGDISDLDGTKPKVQRIGIPDSEVYLASYQSEARYKQGVYVPEVNPRVIVVGNRAYPLTGWCSFEKLHVFRLNGEHYIQSGSRCCGCGIVVEELFRLTPGGPVEVLSDSSFSD